jgi:carotenoid cleavage dioxygenase-like enzyme
VNTYGDGSCKHLFDGPGLLQKFHVHNGAATFSCKFVESRSFKRNIVARRLVLSEFGTVATPDPCQTIFARY